jgi:hypothetical protein
VSFSKQLKSSFSALVNSRLIRYEALPAAIVAIADDAAWDQLFAAAGAPAVDYWLCGFSYGVATGLAADVSLLIDVGYGGVDGAAVAAATVVLTNYPVVITAGVAAVGPSALPSEMLPYPVFIPAGSRMAARIASSPTGTVAFTEFRVILATAVG